MLTVALAAVALSYPAQTIRPYDSRIRLIGRFEDRDRQWPRCAWPGSALEIKFQGTGVDVDFNEEGGNYWHVYLDGRPHSVLAFRKGKNTYNVRTPAGRHVVRMVKRTEAFVGTTQLLGVKPHLTTRLLPGEPPKRRIEYIGDSITCGYGNEGRDETEKFSPATENADSSYAWIAARAVGADPTLIAWSGKKMWPDNTIPDIYDLAVPTDPKSLWRFRNLAPQAIVINLATNDFGPGTPPEEGWTAGYAGFIGRLRLRYPKALVYCATGSMMSDNWPAGKQHLTTLKRYLDRVIAIRAAAGDQNVKRIDFDPQDKAQDGIGSDWHPSVKNHQRMADTLVAALKRDLRW
jgi:lysophospholipase L1-like esterase